MIVWTSFKISTIGQQAIPWPGLDKAISITLYNDKPYAAVWAFQPLATGTAILVGGDPHGAGGETEPAAYFTCIGRHVRRRPGSRS